MHGYYCAKGEWLLFTKWDFLTYSVLLFTLPLHSLTYRPSLLPSFSPHLCSLYFNALFPSRYVRNAKFLNEQSRPGILMMSRCLLEMYGADLRSSYQHAFIYIRQLAIHLRGAITKRTRESLRNVYNWQYVKKILVYMSSYVILVYTPLYTHLHLTTFTLIYTRYTCTYTIYISNTNTPLHTL